MPAIKTQGLTKRFGRFTAVDRLALEVEEGEVFGLLGSNGAGKTTTVQILTTLLKPTAGTARIHGHDIRTSPRKVRSVISAVSDGINLYPDLTLEQNLRFFGKGYGLSGVLLRNRVQDVMSRVDMMAWADARVDTYSFGMRKRAQIAVALIHGPKVLFMDEATTGIDPQNSIRIRNLARELAEEGMTIVWTTHMMEEPERIADRVAIMSRGVVRALGEPDELARLIENEKTIEIRTSRETTQERVRFLGGVLRRAGYPVVEGDARTRAVKLVVAKDFDVNEILRVTNRFGYIHSINTIGPSLEDVFIHYTSPDAGKPRAVAPSTLEDIHDGTSLQRSGPAARRADGTPPTDGAAAKSGRRASTASKTADGRSRARTVDARGGTRGKGAKAAANADTTRRKGK